MGIQRLTVASMLAATCLAQNRAYDFYPGFRGWAQEVRRTDRSISIPQVMERYVAKLAAEGVAKQEIERRTALLRSSRNELEADFWNRYFTQGASNYNRAPNAFLVEVVEGKSAGTALDYGMGEGRNALWLARNGWRVSGFDPADAAVGLAQKRAAELGLRLDTRAVRDTEYEFGRERFDLVLFSWTMPDASTAPKVVDALKPGGLVVMECGADWVGRNQMLKLFEGLQVVQYEIVSGKSDFFERREMDILRLVARK